MLKLLLELDEVVQLGNHVVDVFVIRCPLFIVDDEAFADIDSEANKSNCLAGSRLGEAQWRHEG